MKTQPENNVGNDVEYHAKETARHEALAAKHRAMADHHRQVRQDTANPRDGLMKAANRMGTSY